MAVRNGVPDAVLGDLYPFEDRYVRLSDGTTMHYVEWGGDFRKPTVLLLHGNPTWSFLYRDWIRSLSKVARVVAVDHAGFGRSDHPSDPRYYSLEKHIKNLEELVSELGLRRVVPVVQDWGGPIGLGYATRHASDISGLVILNTWAFTRRAPIRLPLGFRLLKAPGIGEFAYGRRNLFVERFIPKLMQKPLPPSVMDGYRHPFPTAASRVGVVQSPRMIPDRPGHPDWDTLSRIERDLPNLTVPAEILWGAKDPAFSKRFAWAFSEALPSHPKPVFFDHAGHWLQEDIPDLLVPRVASFLRSV
ncbi:MAG: alpha/beta fold hydrolase [Candidatus Thermoplasmatota archaeon]